MFVGFSLKEACFFLKKKKVSKEPTTLGYFPEKKVGVSAEF